MVGLDRQLVAEIDWETTCAEISIDARTDFILSPHFDAIYLHNSENLIAQVRADLASGRYNPRLPITFSVPKDGWLTRPGSILEPADRLVYHGLINHSIDGVEQELDRNRTYSHVHSEEAEQLFEQSHESWEQFQGSVAQICANSEFVLRTDVANYFETIQQHHLINLLTDTAVDPRTVNILEEILLAFRQRNSSGIIQGVYPSDVLGNFYLLDLDGDCEAQGLSSARYVDDIYIGFDSLEEARSHLIRIIDRLRRQGLNLNSAKTKIAEGNQIIREEQEIDRRFTEVRESIDDWVDDIVSQGYGFQGDWINGGDEPEADDLDSMAVRSLMEDAAQMVDQTEKIHRFCLPLLRGANDDSALDTSIEGIHQHPHLTRLYSSYLTQFTRSNNELVGRIEQALVADSFFCDYQRMYSLAAILNADGVHSNTVQKAIQWLESTIVGQETRAICAIFVAKFGNARQKQTVFMHYDNETSEYVRSAILYAMQYFSAARRRNAKLAWGRQNPINTLISDVI